MPRGKKTGNYEDFFFTRAADLKRHANYPDKLAAMQRLPLPESSTTEPTSAHDLRPWYKNLEDLLEIIIGVDDE